MPGPPGFLCSLPVGMLPADGLQEFLIGPVRNSFGLKRSWPSAPIKPSAFPRDLAESAFWCTNREMLDLVTLLSAVGLQEELAESRKASPVITAAESSTTSFVEDAAEQISLALESFEGALSSALGAATGSSSSEPAPGPAPCKTV
ncbi:unnamed protein product [Prorocentrum cordatum]|uniref:Uncharacterized protein n=1 Tax=Prorocentrum cordatum TaxID=2364126 RepID=A0ABN9QM34_9DINO|nr:unnamed protein product [Polarella glacialis]